MTAAVPSADSPGGQHASSASRTAFSSTGPIFFWLVIQLIAIFVAAKNWPLSAGYPQPAHLYSIEVLLAVQIAVSAMLFPILFQDVRTAAITIFSSWPFLVLAGLLSAIPYDAIVAGATFLTLWLIVLWLWNCALRTMAWKQMGVAFAVFITIGGVIFWYLAIEFDDSDYRKSWFGPLLAALSQVRRPWRNSSPWFLLAAPGVIAGIVCLVHRRRSRHVGKYYSEI